MGRGTLQNQSRRGEGHAWTQGSERGYSVTNRSLPLWINRRRDKSLTLELADEHLDPQRIDARNLEVPSGNAVGTARAIAHAYSVLATGGRELGLRKTTLDLLGARAIPPARGFTAMLEGRRRAVLTRLHETDPSLAVRHRQFVRIIGRRRLSGIRRSHGGCWLRVRDEPDGDTTHR